VLDHTVDCTVEWWEMQDSSSLVLVDHIVDCTAVVEDIGRSAVHTALHIVVVDCIVELVMQVSSLAFVVQFVEVESRLQRYWEQHSLRSYKVEYS